MLNSSCALMEGKHDGEMEGERVMRGIPRQHASSLYYVQGFCSKLSCNPSPAGSMELSCANPSHGPPVGAPATCPLLE